IDLDPYRCDEQMLHAEVTSGAADQQVALRDDARFVARLEHLALPAPSPRRRPAESFRVYARSPGSLESVRLQAVARRSPGPGEVEIRIAAAALNFIDVLKAMAIYPGLEPSPDTALGAEGAGVVTAVGPGVQGLTLGDEVVAMTPSYRSTGLLASHVTMPAELALRRPAGLTAEAASALPIAYVTAYYALQALARIRAGDRVLVHSASGGVGLAAINLCRAAGVEVIATAGSEARRDHVRALGVEHVFDSRRLAFAQEVRACTGGRGVDVVLN